MGYEQEPWGPVDQPQNQQQPEYGRQRDDRGRQQYGQQPPQQQHQYGRPAQGQQQGRPPRQRRPPEPQDGRGYFEPQQTPAPRDPRDPYGEQTEFGTRAAGSRSYEPAPRSEAYGPAGAAAAAPWSPVGDGAEPDELDSASVPGTGRGRTGGRAARPRSRAANATGPGAGNAAGAGTGPGRVNDDIDLDEVDPKGRAVARHEKTLKRLGNTRRKKANRIIAGSTAGVLVAVLALGGYLVHHMLSNIATVSLDNLKDRPAASKPNALGQVPLNILVLGSQTRDGQNLATHVGNSTKDGTDLSDTAFLMHISANHKWSEIVSIPRDLFVPIPACQDRNNPNQTDPAQAHGQFYDAMGEGGPACAVATVEQMTNIRVDHFVELTFNAFIQLTDAVGGVQVCVPSPGIDDPNYSGLVMSAGLHTVTGNQALAFVRDRHGLASGMDTQRIRMQQMFMSSLFNKLVSNGTLENPLTLYNIGNAVTQNITVDTGLDNISTMVSIAGAVGGINKSYMQYMTAPYELDNPGQFAYDPQGEHSSPGPGFDQLWTDLRNDQPLPGSPAAAEYGSAPAAPASPGAPPAGKPSAAPSQTVALNTLHVQVFNGTDTSGEAAHAASYLQAQGVTTSIGYSGFSGYQTTTIFYPSGDQAQADSLQNQIAGSVTKESSNVSQLTLVIGANAPSAVVNASSSSSSSGSSSGSGSTASAAPSPTSTISAQTRNGSEDICSNLPAVGGYGGAPSD